jgi:hypothetical protein
MDGMAIVEDPVIRAALDEAAAYGLVMQMLAPLDREARDRVLRWAADRVDRAGIPPMGAWPSGIVTFAEDGHDALTREQGP